jgi:tRNA nucleotidyltransferase (CCA-adding enzyme)
MNLSGRLEKQLPSGLVEFMQAAGLMAANQGHGLYLVGGMVRDLLLERENQDLDLVSEGNAPDLAQQLAEINRAKVTVHPRFQTANLKWDGWSVDIATVRSETYARPGALPTVAPGSLDTDLFRRDFTVNAMAVELVPGRWGELIDIYDGQADLKKGLVRILHENSFIDDATRIWRAVRYEQRLDFKIEPDTLRLLEEHIAYLDTISGDRIRHELELVLNEDRPERALHRAGELGVLSRVNPGLKGDVWLVEKFREARETASPGRPSPELCLAVLAYRLTDGETEELIQKLRLRKSQVQVIRSVQKIKGGLAELETEDIAPSGVYEILHGRSRTALAAVSIAAGSPAVRKHIDLYLNELRDVKTALTGTDLHKMGIPPGPRIKEILSLLHRARLDGEVSSRTEEEETVRKQQGF